MDTSTEPFFPDGIAQEPEGRSGTPQGYAVYFRRTFSAALCIRPTKKRPHRSDPTDLFSG